MEHCWCLKALKWLILAWNVPFKLSGLASRSQNVSLANPKCMWLSVRVYSRVCATERLCMSMEEKHEERVKTGRTVQTFSLFIHHRAHLCSHVHDPTWLWQSHSGSTSTCHVELSSLIWDQETRGRHAEVSLRGCVWVCVWPWGQALDRHKV